MTAQIDRDHILEITSKRMKEILAYLDMDQATLARKTHYTKTQINYVTNGKRRMSEEMAKAIAAVVNERPLESVNERVVAVRDLDDAEYEEYIKKGYSPDDFVVKNQYYRRYINHDYIRGVSDQKYHDEKPDTRSAIYDGIEDILMRLGYHVENLNTLGIFAGTLPPKGVLELANTSGDTVILRRSDGQRVSLSSLETTELFNDFFVAIKMVVDRTIDKKLTQAKFNSILERNETD